MFYFLIMMTMTLLIVVLLVIVIPCFTELYTYDVTLLDHVETLHVITYLLLQR